MFYRFLRPVVGKGSFPSPVLGKVQGSPVHFWEIILDSPVHAVLGKGVPKSNTGKRVYRFPCPVLGKIFICSQVQYWKRVLGSPVHSCVKVVYVLKSNTGKGSRFPSPVLEKGSIGSPVQYWKRFCRFPSPVLGKDSMYSQLQYWEKVI